MSQGVSRREMLKSAGMGALALSAGYAAFAQNPPVGGTLPKRVPYELPPLPYAYDALAPALEEKIVRIHHDKHHAGYVKGLNAALDKLERARASGDLGDIKALSRDLAFNGSGDVLHTLYWQSMAPGGAGEPSGLLKEAIERDFGSVDACSKQFAAASKAVEGSGWGILGWEPVGARLLVLQAEKHQDLTVWGVAPLLCCDVWEHAYYLQYENRRGDYVDAFMKLIDWNKTAARFQKAIASAPVLTPTA